MVADLEAGKHEHHSAAGKWRRIVRCKPINIQTPDNVDIISRFEKGSAIAQGQLGLDAGGYWEYVRSEFLRQSDRFQMLFPDGVVGHAAKAGWAIRAVGRLHRDLVTSQNFNIAAAVTMLQGDGLLRIPDEKRQEQSILCIQMLFTLLAPMLMLYSPRPDLCSGASMLRIERSYPSGHGTFEQYTKDSIDVTEADRPIGDMLRGFGNLHPRYGHEYSEVVQPVLSSQFNAATFTSIGRIRFAWTDLLPAHLDFNLSTRTLYLFQRPTFCLLNMPRKGVEDPGWNSILARCLTSSISESGDAAVSEYMEEVILSLHVIFGQSVKSTKVFDSREVSSRLSTVGADPLLLTICSERWPFLDWACRPKEVYCFDQDFPVLGPKLQRVHEYMQGKQPINIWHLWKDDRNSLQWWTFWAVVVLGGLGLLLAAMQVGLTAAQLYYAAQSPACNA